MAREVAVDVASHSSQVDPILADLAEQLADLDARDADSAVLLCDTRSIRVTQPTSTPTTGWTTCGSRCKFAAAVQAALDDGHRVFGEPSPHPLLTRAVEQTAAAADITVAALAGMRREQPVPYGLRGFLADLYGAGAAIDFSVTSPGGRLVDAPLPTWTHQQLYVESARLAGAWPVDHRSAPAAGRARAAARRARAPRLAGRGRHRDTALAGRPPGQRGRRSSRRRASARWRWPSAEAVLGPDSEVRDFVSSRC